MPFSGKTNHFYGRYMGRNSYASASKNNSATKHNLITLSVAMVTSNFPTKKNSPSVTGRPFRRSARDWAKSKCLAKYLGSRGWRSMTNEHVSGGSSAPSRPDASRRPLIRLMLGLHYCDDELSHACVVRPARDGGGGGARGGRGRGR